MISFTGYGVMSGFICKGSNIKWWSDESNAEYGDVKGVTNCQEICACHIECGGFSHRKSDDVCFWKREPLDKPFTNPHVAKNFDCYQKIKGNINMDQYKNSS